MYFQAFLFLLLLALLIAVVPIWPYSRRWGYTPTLVAVAMLVGLLALSYIGYIGPWQQVGPRFVAGTAGDTSGAAE
jgi:hypothetical protein